MIGPMPRPRADTPAQMPMARPRSVGSVKTLVSTDSVDGMMNAPPTPISERVRIRTLAFVANAESTDPRPNTDNPKASAL